MATMAKRQMRENAADEESDLEADAAEYERTAREIAEKVRRQQEGEESNMLSAEYKDEEYQLSVDQVQELLRANQLSQLNRSVFSRRRTNHEDMEVVENEGEAQRLLSKWFVERSKFVPMRLTLEERKRLRLVDAFLRGSTYVNRIDAVYSATAASASTSSSSTSSSSVAKNKAKRAHEKLRCIATTLVGLIAALDYEAGKEVAETLDFRKYAEVIREAFEITRRYKIMNPDRLRDSYGKMIMLLQDASSHEAREELGFNIVAPIRTVHSVLAECNRLEVLSSEWTSTATMEIITEPGESREDVRRRVKAKERALDSLANELSVYGKLSRDDVKQCLHSMGDNASYLNSNCKPIDEMIAYLKRFFDPRVVGESPPPDRSLAIHGGENGARLTHSHERQFLYVLQTMTLWREILHEIFRLWTLAETDLLDPDLHYKWRDTGQGMHRLQDSPRISKSMHGILYAVQQSLGREQGWVGSSVIHINDSNVPNALVFIDKWNQVPRILNPLVHCLRHIDSVVAKDANLVRLVTDAFGGIDEAKVRVLHSFFRQGFDGSGGDDWFSAGSCVDARLTSSWNWCQDLPSKDFFFLFRLSGFMGFDGSFN